MANQQFDDEFTDSAAPSSRGFLPILWQRKALVMLGMVLGLAGGFLFYWQREPVYQANAQVLVIKKHNTPLAMANGLDPLKGILEDYMGTHVVVLKSPLIIDKAVKKKDLTSLRTFEGSLDPVGQILGGLTVTRDTKEAANNVLYLAFRGPVPEDCSKILTALIDSYQEYLDKQFRDVNVDILERITKARDILNKQLVESQNKRLKFSDETPLYWNGKDGTAVLMERINDFEKKRSSQLLHQDELKVRIKFVETAIKDGKGAESLVVLARIGDAKAKAAEKTLEEQLLPLRLAERELIETYEADHPKVRGVRDRMAMIAASHKKLYDDADMEKDPVKRHLNLLREELRSTEMFLKEVDVRLADLNKLAREFKKYDIQAQDLNNNAMAIKDLYDQVIRQLNQMGLSRDSGGFNTSVLAQSSIGVKVAPSAFQTLAGGAMIGLLLGIGLAFLADLTDKGFRSADEVRRRLRVPLLGHVPFLKPDPEVERKVKSGEVQIDPLLCTWFLPKSLEAEAFRAIRTSLLFSLQGQGHRVIQVTSPSKGDGKSLVVANLAISIAQSDKKVLIIDADCRRPRQNKVFNLPNTKGLVQVIKQKTPWRECALPAGLDGLWIMPSGPIPPNPAELLTSPIFKQLLAEAREHYDLVIVDSPPLLAVTDPCIVAGGMDGVMMVLRLSRQGRPNAERAVEIMKSLKVNMLGLVVNGVTRQAGGGIYNSENYDYSESYTETETADQEESYYYYHEVEAEAAAEPKPAGAESTAGGVWRRMFSRKS